MEVSWASNLWDLLWPREGNNITLSDLLIEQKQPIPVYTVPPTDASYKDLLLREAPKPFDYKSVSYKILDLRKHPRFSVVVNKRRERALPCMLNSMLIINDYIHLEKALSALDEEFQMAISAGRSLGQERGAAIVGSPGIGKTCALSYFLVSRLCAGQDTVFVSTNGRYTWFNKDGAKTYKDFDKIDRRFVPFISKDLPNAWVLLDGVAPPSEMMAWDCLAIQATSPKASKYKEWLKQWKADVWHVDIWDWEEYAGMITLHGENDAYYPYWVLYQRFGGIPRLGSRAEGRTLDKLTAILESYDRGVKNVASQFALRDVSLSPTEFLKASDSHVLIATRPPTPPNETSFIGENHFLKRTPSCDAYFHEGGIEYLTLYIECIIAKAFADVFRNKAVDYFSRLLHEPTTRTAAGRAFEIMIHEVIKGRRIADVQNGLLSLEGPDSKCKQRMPLDSVGGPDFHHQYRDVVDLKAYLRSPSPPRGAGSPQMIYLQPTAPNFPSIDSFVYDIAGKNPPIFIQTTVGNAHAVKSKALKDIWISLPRKREGYLVFIVPDDPTIATFSHQPILPKSDEDFWSRHLHQMKLMVSWEKLQKVWVELGMFGSESHMDGMEAEH